MKSNGKTDSYLTTWLPIKQAVLDKKLKDESGEIWTAIVCYQTQEKAPYPAGAFREHKKRTGDSLPY